RPRRPAPRPARAGGGRGRPGGRRPGPAHSGGRARGGRDGQRGEGERERGGTGSRRRRPGWHTRNGYSRYSTGGDAFNIAGFRGRRQEAPASPAKGRRRRRLLRNPFVAVPLILAVILALVLGGAAVTRARTPVESPYRTQAVTRTTVTGVVATSGPIGSATSLTLNFKQSGVLSELKVKVGDKVQPGQVLAIQDAGDLNAQVTAAQANLDKAITAYNQLLAGAAPEDLAVAQASVDSAKAQLAQAQKNYDTTVQGSQRDLQVSSAGVGSADTQLSGAQNNLNDVVQVQNARDIQAAQVTVQNAQVTLANARKNYDAVVAQVGRDNDAAQLAVNNAQTALDNAQRNLAATQAGTQEDLKAAQQQLATAQIALQDAENNINHLAKGPTGVAMRNAGANRNAAADNLANATSRNRAQLQSAFD